MKVSRQRVAENRERIIKTASELFRERGIDGIGLSDLMKEAGLTHGAFYGYFDSKDALVSQACASAFSGMKHSFARKSDKHATNPLRSLANSYLSQAHRDNFRQGCPVAALAGDISRQPSPVRRSFTEELRPFFDFLASLVPGRSKTVRRKKAIAVFASLIGGLVLARAVNDKKLSHEILNGVSASLRCS
jgi:TetR/AcrR family transcriptional repressor of nem operon